MTRIAIFISGRGSNMKAIVAQCKSGILKGLAEPVLVFSNQPEAEGLVYAEKMGIKTASITSKGLKRTEFDKKVLNLLSEYNPDFIVLAGYMRILSPEFIQKYPKKIINIHPADTTKHQGLHGYEWAWENELEETFITIHYVDEGLDTGSIIAQEKVNLEGVKTLEEVEGRGLAVEHQLYSETLKKIFKNS
jgi:phosphoribosylglycinamide formyltransferase-1